MSMRLLYVTSTLPTGIGETFIYPEIRELMRRGHEVRIVPLRPKETSFHQEGAELLKHSEVQGVLSLRVLAAAFLAVLTSPIRAIRALKVLLTWNPWHFAKNMAVYPKALWLARLASDWKADHIHAHWAATTASMAMAASEYSGIPWSFTAHRWDIRENNLLKRKISHSRFARFISRRGIETARKLNALPSPTENVRLLYMGVRVEKDSVRRRTNETLTEDRFRIVCPANLLPIKGHEYLLRALCRLDNRQGLELWIAGDGPLETSLRQLTDALGLRDVVRFLGRLDHSELLRLYRENQVDLVCLASLELGLGLHEGIPVALIEAMSYGIPVVATNSGGIGELLGDGAGLLVEPQDVEALADAISRVRGDKELYRDLSRRARERVEQAFMIENVVKELEILFQT